MLESLRDEAMLKAVKTALDGHLAAYEGDYLSVTGGKTTPMRAIYQTVTAEDGTFLGAVGLFEDISEREQHEVVLRESEQRYRELFEAVSDAIFLIDNATGLILEANNAATAMYGYSREELLVRSNVDLSAEEDETERVTKKAEISSEQVVKIPLRYHRKNDGTVFPVEITGRFFTRKGQPVHIAAIRDITERKRTEDQLRKSENAVRQSEMKLRAVLDATPFPVAVVDLEDNVIGFWSRSAHTLFGHTASTASEWYRVAYPDPGYQQEVIERWKPFLEIARVSGQPVNTGEYQVTCSDGSVRICELYATFLPDNLIVTFNDITERQRVEEERLRLEERLRRSEKMEALGTLAGGVAHDLNNVLGIVVGYSEMLLDDLDESAPGRSDAMEVLKGGQRAAAIVQDLLTLARRGVQVEKY